MTTSYEILAQRRIQASSDIQRHRFLFSWGGIPCFSRGELVALTGKAKSGKTYACSILMALAQKPQLMGLQRIDEAPLRVLWIDTEQSADTTQEILCLRVGRLIEQEISDEQFFVYNFRQDNWQERLGLVLDSICMHKPDLVIFDGIRDVVGNINDYQEAQVVLGKLLSIASWSNACIVCVLHQNKSLEDKTLRGALGTELQNKSFETYECVKNPDTHIFTMRQTATRKYDITQGLDFTVNGEGLPVMRELSVANNPVSTTSNTPSTEQIVKTIAGKEEVMRSSAFANMVKDKYPAMRYNDRYKVFLYEAFDKKLITKETLPSGDIFYRFTHNQTTLFEDVF